MFAGKTINSKMIIRKAPIFLVDFDKSMSPPKISISPVK
jgi:hypothetical protein